MKRDATQKDIQIDQRNTYQEFINLLVIPIYVIFTGFGGKCYF
jgi:hypothetical protein